MSKNNVPVLRDVIRSTTHVDGPVASLEANHVMTPEQIAQTLRTNERYYKLLAIFTGVSSTVIVWRRLEFEIGVD